MKITKDGKLIQIAFMPRIFPVNCYLVEEERELTLIDAALPFSVKGILKAARQIGKPITRIALTHAHGDHVGALDGLKEALPDAKVYISQRDAKLLAGDRSLNEGEPNLPIRGDVPKSIKTKPDVQLQSGDSIGSLQAVNASGHTPGSMAFLDLRTRALIAGDAFQVRGGIAVSGVMKPWFPFPAMATWNKASSLESARRLKDLQPSLLAVGHGRMVSNPVAAMESALEEATRKIIVV
ncbi:MBL fold metallo-hydrolase [Paenibacillus hexagrammi]|uniref:MBL fold metallo-hydrolase n=1 Tax=Paenibacillus hexagrammi TaxID=2908839 RepID=A0ABY3SK21_9BACL|nr:MBL fold metallo-hydrolase [Paenibacillus sp. YPD9-1]UJF33490.1 MBL fold metallo-hydrolase [Paenibacillus sp. YPD9-1]